MIYYKRLTKEEKKKVFEKFKKDDEFKIYRKANKIFIISIIGFIFAIGVSIFDIVNKTGLLNYILDGLLFIFTLFFIFRMNSFKNTIVNSFALRNKKNTK